MKDGKDIADYSIDFGTSNGASYVEARFIDSWDESYSSRNGMFLGILEGTKQGIGIRVLAEGGMGFGSTEQLDKNNIEKLITSIIKMAKATKRKEPIVFSEEKIEDVSWKTEVKKPFQDVSREDKKFYIRNMDKRIKKETNKKVKNRIAHIQLHTEDKYIVTSEGAKNDCFTSMIVTMFMNTARAKVGTEQKMFSMGGTAGWEWFGDIGFEDEVVQSCLGLVKTAENAVNMKFDKPIDVVVSGEVAGIMCHENIGHPSEADRIYGREGAQAGESFYGDLLKKEKLGEATLGTELVTVIEDPTVPGSAGFYLYDDECIKARPRYLIKKGKLNELLLNREFAAKFNTKSNASSRAITYNREPISRMANTFFEPGDFTKEELIAGVKEGIYMNSFTEWNIDSRRWNSKYVGQEVYLIKKGEVMNTMVRRPVLEITTPYLLNSIDGISKENVSYLGLCGKSDPMQGIPVSMGGPHARLRNIKIKKTS